MCVRARRCWRPPLPPPTHSAGLPVSHTDPQHPQLLPLLQTPEGIRVPEVLVPFMGGRTLLPYTREKPVNVEAKMAAKKEGKAAAGGAGGAAAPEEGASK